MKRASPYLPGKRSLLWIKIEIVKRQVFVVGGWVPERSGLAERIGAILVGIHDCDGNLLYAGKVGTRGDAKPEARSHSRRRKSA